MDRIPDEILYNSLKVSKIELTDPYEGTVNLLTDSGKVFKAFFYGQKFETGRTYQIQFSCLDFPIKWEVMFSENKEHLMTLVPDNGHCSYLAYGKVLSINPVVADFGDIRMEIGDWTHDDKVIGEYIYYKIERLDILEVKTATNSALPAIPDRTSRDAPPV